MSQWRHVKRGLSHMIWIPAFAGMSDEMRERFLLEDGWCKSHLV